MHDPHHWVVGVSCCLSMFGSLVLILSYICIQSTTSDRSTPIAKLLLFLSMADFITALGYFESVILPYEPGESHEKWQLCQIQALVGIFFPVASFLWTDCICYFIYRTVCRNGVYHTTERLFRIFHVICWGVPTVLVVLVGSFGVEGNDENINSHENATTGGWCWIRGRGTSVVWELVAGKIVEWLSAMWCIYACGNVYWRVKALERIADSSFMISNHIESHGLLSSHLYRSSDDRDSTKSIGSGVSSEETVWTQPYSVCVCQPTTHNSAGFGGNFTFFRRYMLAIPLVFFFCRFWGSLRYVLKLANTGSPRFLWIMQSALDPSQGFFNCIVFGIGNPKLRHTVYSAVSTLKARCIQACSGRRGTAYRLQLGLVDEGDTEVQEEEEWARTLCVDCGKVIVERVDGLSLGTAEEGGVVCGVMFDDEGAESSSWDDGGICFYNDFESSGSESGIENGDDPVNRG